jgi:hypothetical protein
MKEPINNIRPVSPFPDIGGAGKEAMVVSATTVFRRRDPTNKQTSSHVPNFVFDHSKQSPLWPDGKPNALIESTHATGPSPSAYRTINRSGRPYALGVHVGGSPDDFIATPRQDERPGKKILK